MRNKPVKPGVQLALPVTLADYATFDNFYAAGNEAPLAALAALDGETTRSLWLWGPADVGKSHLLQAACAGREGSAFLPGATLRNLPADALAGFDRYGRVCLDDLDCLLGDEALETAVFHLYNRLADANATLVVATTKPPGGVDFALPDLASRLRAGSLFELRSLNDEDRLAALKLRARRRGCTLPSETGRYLLTHYRRDMTSLCALLDTLDLASLAAKRRLTIPFVKTILEG